MTRSAKAGPLERLVTWTLLLLLCLLVWVGAITVILGLLDAAWGS